MRGRFYLYKTDEHNHSCGWCYDGAGKAFLAAGDTGPSRLLIIGQMIKKKKKQVKARHPQQVHTPASDNPLNTNR